MQGIRPSSTHSAGAVERSTGFHFGWRCETMQAAGEPTLSCPVPLSNHSERPHSRMRADV